MEAFSDILLAAQQGRPEAREALYQRYALPLANAAKRRLSPFLRRRYDTLDLTQSVFTDVLRSLPRLEDRGEGAFRHLLMIRLENKVKDKLRRSLLSDRKRREETLENPLEIVDHRRPGIEEADGSISRKILDLLPPDRAEVVRLRLIEGHSFPEIAAQLGLPTADTARKRFSRSMCELRRRLT